MVIKNFFKLILSLSTIASSVWSSNVSLPTWGYDCQNNKCVKVPFLNEYSSQSLSVCRMLCGDEIGTIWPKPSGSVKIGKDTAQIDYQHIDFQISSTSISEALWTMVKSRFQEQVNSKIPKSVSATNGGNSLVVRIHLEGLTEIIPKLSYETDESYKLGIVEIERQVFVDINATTFFGARHGLETLTQLIVYEDIGNSIQVLIDTEINDSPAYKHRGVLLDTGRHYFSVKSIERIINGMAMSKLNTFHWHIVDSNSFPLVVKSHPELHRFGSYSPRKIYTNVDIAEVIAYALIRGVNVIPEFGAPAHIGEGWQKKNLTVCFNAQPWKEFCSQPPCGQLDPTIDAVYDVLEDIYSEIFKSFEPNIFHMGGNTVSFACWNSSQAIRNWMIDKGWHLKKSDFVKLLGHFQSQALAKVDTILKNKKIPIILWDGPMTKGHVINKFLNASRYIIQTSSDMNDRNIGKILDNGFRMISTHLDLVITSETANWSGGGAIYHGWQKFYQSKPDSGVLRRRAEQILGSEAAIWSEQIDEFTVDGLLWPKASALAERLWTNPEESWHKAESRLLIHRELLLENGIAGMVFAESKAMFSECIKERSLSIFYTINYIFVKNFWFC